MDGLETIIMILIGYLGIGCISSKWLSVTMTRLYPNKNSVEWFTGISAIWLWPVLMTWIWIQTGGKK